MCVCMYLRNVKQGMVCSSAEVMCVRVYVCVCMCVCMYSWKVKQGMVCSSAEVMCVCMYVLMESEAGYGVLQC
jgi:hypothetical protein